MALGLTRINPNMKLHQMAAAINENFMLLENLNRTQMYKDTSGKVRIIIGRLPDGEYGIVISKEGYDARQLFTT